MVVMSIGTLITACGYHLMDIIVVEYGIGVIILGGENITDEWEVGVEEAGMPDTDIM